MSYRLFVKWKDEAYDTVYLIIRMLCNPLMMILQCLWIVISCQEENFIKNSRILADKDRNNNRDVMPNEFIQGVAVTVNFLMKRRLSRNEEVFSLRCFRLKLVHRHWPFVRHYVGNFGHSIGI